jgi:large subunit ribosomal protein L15
MPLIRRLPKRGFNNAAFKTIYATVNVGDLNGFEDGATVNETALLERGLIRGIYDGVKILGNGELSRKLTVIADKVSASASEKIQKAGGTTQVPA